MNNNNSLVSVIVPVYNTEAYIKRCLDSILNQNYRNLEIILINDGSTDNSPAICDFYAETDSRIRVIHKENGGQSSARNIGLDVCTGDYISFIDSDDWIESGMYATLLDHLEKYGASLAVCGRYDAYEDASKKKVGKSIENDGVFDAYDVLPEMAIGRLSDFSVCDKLFHRELWQNTRFPEGEIYEDFAVMYKVLIEAERVVLCKDAFYVYFHRKNSTVTSGFREALTDYPKQTGRFILDITEWYPEYMEHAVWTHIKALQCVLISLLKSDRETYLSHRRLYEEYIRDIREYRHIWIKSHLFSVVDRLICVLLLHKQFARIIFVFKSRL